MTPQVPIAFCWLCPFTVLCPDMSFRPILLRRAHLNVQLRYKRLPRRYRTTLPAVKWRPQYTYAMNRIPPTSTLPQSTRIDLHVLVSRSEKDIWEGPYTLLDTQGETRTVLLPPPLKPSTFLSTVVTRFIADKSPEVEEQQVYSKKNISVTMTLTIVI